MAGGILIFSIIVVNIAPNINHLVPDPDLGYQWSELSCKFLKDQYKYAKDQKMSQEYIDERKKEKNRCERKQAMVGLEYASLNCNLIFGFICALLGFFHYFNIGDFGKISSFVGLGTGIVGFVLTLVYVIESGLVFNDKEDHGYLKPDSDGAILEWDNSKESYVCIFYKKDNPDSVYLKYSNYNNKYLGYTKEYSFRENDENYELYDINSYNKGCNIEFPYNSIEDSNFYSYCQKYQNGEDKFNKLTYIDKSGNQKDCKKIYYLEDEVDYEYKIIYDRWLTTIIFSCFIAILDIGLALFGFFLMSNSNKGGL